MMNWQNSVKLAVFPSPIDSWICSRDLPRSKSAATGRTVSAAKAQYLQFESWLQLFGTEISELDCLPGIDHAYLSFSFNLERHGQGNESELVVAFVSLARLYPQNAGNSRHS